jgi:hypothetical protein
VGHVARIREQDPCSFDSLLLSSFSVHLLPSLVDVSAVFTLPDTRSAGQNRGPKSYTGQHPNEDAAMNCAGSEPAATCRNI